MSNITKHSTVRKAGFSGFLRSELRNSVSSPLAFSASKQEIQTRESIKEQTLEVKSEIRGDPSRRRTKMYTKKKTQKAKDYEQEIHRVSSLKLPQWLHWVVEQKYKRMAASDK